MSGIDPVALRLLSAWLPSNDDPDRPQMQLATVDETGRADARTVLLSEWDDTGFVFHTDTGSRKVAQLTANGSVALVILWPGFTRQLVIRGIAETASTARLDAAFALRSPYLKQLAWQNSAIVARLDRAARVAEWTRFAAEHDPAALTAPPTWTGYLVRPDRLTFWESDASAPSHRIEFRRDLHAVWSIHQLAG